MSVCYLPNFQPIHWSFEYYQKHVYANGERIQLATLADEGFDCYPTVYVHEDALGRAHYYSTTCADKFAEMKYDVWGDPDYTSKVVRDSCSDYVYAVFTGHVYDVVLDIYFADARFYDASSRQWMAKDPVKDGLNWYQYCNNNPATYWDPTGLNWFDGNNESGLLADFAIDLPQSLVKIRNANNQASKYFAALYCWVQKNNASDAADLLLGESFSYGRDLPEWLRMFVAGLQGGIASDAKAPYKLQLLYAFFGRLVFVPYHEFVFRTRMGDYDEALAFFNFVRDEDGVFHTTTHCWQQYAGYCDLYDWFFDVGTSMERRKIQFTAEYEGHKENYAIWMWKGNYMNLGAGAETGIYVGSDPLWEIDTDLAMPMTLTVRRGCWFGLSEKEVFSYEPTEDQWWITGFNPDVQFQRASNLTVTGTIEFADHQEMINPFMTEAKNQNVEVWYITETKIGYRW